MHVVQALKDMWMYVNDKYRNVPAKYSFILWQWYHKVAFGASLDWLCDTVYMKKKKKKLNITIKVDMNLWYHEILVMKQKLLILWYRLFNFVISLFVDKDSDVIK